MVTVEFRLLGSFAFLGADGWQRAPSRTRGGDLLKYLACHARAPISRDVLGEVLWPELDNEESKHRLHLAASGARSALKGTVGQINPIVYADGLYAWNDAIDVRCDTDELARCLEDGSETALARGVSSYAGQFLAGDTAEWIIPFRVLYEHMYVTILEALAKNAYRSRDYASAAKHALELVIVDRANERATQLAMICLAKTGRRSSALAEFDALERYLQHWIGVKPMQETQQVRVSILRGEVERLEYAEA